MGAHRRGHRGMMGGPPKELPLHHSRRGSCASLLGEQVCFWGSTQHVRGDHRRRFQRFWHNWCRFQIFPEIWNSRCPSQPLWPLSLHRGIISEAGSIPVPSFPVLCQVLARSRWRREKPQLRSPGAAAERGWPGRAPCPRCCTRGLGAGAAGRAEGHGEKRCLGFSGNLWGTRDAAFLWPLQWLSGQRALLEPQHRCCCCCCWSWSRELRPGWQLGWFCWLSKCLPLRGPAALGPRQGRRRWLSLHWVPPAGLLCQPAGAVALLCWVSVQDASSPLTSMPAVPQRYSRGLCTAGGDSGVIQQHVDVSGCL